MKWREDLADALILFSPAFVGIAFVALLLILDAIGFIE